MTLRPSGLIAALLAGFTFPFYAHAASLTLEERVAAQRAIEQVYWSHKIWPKDNPARKPPLSAVMSDEAIRAKVEDYLKKSNALAKWWQRPVTSEQLQAEIDRLARDSRDPKMLRELYSALGDKPSLIAETLARQTLVERLIRNWYATDDRFHGGAKRDAAQALARFRGVADMKALGGEYAERTFVRRANDEGESGATHEADFVALDGAEWAEWTGDLARRFGTAPEALPVQRLSPLQEEPERFFVTALLSFEAGRAIVASVSWPKKPFDAWWSAERGRTSAEIVTEAGAYRIEGPLSGGCVEDTWDTRFYVPTGRWGHTAVWTGSEMIIWGGTDSTGGRYNPATDSWTATSTGANVPSARNGHTAVWTGTEMIVWGGADSTGGRYNPATDSWTATSTGANVPDGRGYHTAVWTGTEMIVWGANYYDGRYHYLNTGGRYNPATDSWTATSTGANVPDGRRNFTAVWTGAEMVVWGGDTYDGVSHYVNTGGRYNPSTDSWMPTSGGADLPSARSLHAALWTGTEMIVWGGFGGSYENTGGRYDPSTDSWAATSTGVNVPDGRAYHTVLWTGAEMIVWGGKGLAILNTGGRYNPATDSWMMTSTGTNVPEARYGHTAVWTGTEMIVWGGEGGSPLGLQTGGRYNPATDSWAPTSMGVSVPSVRLQHTSVWTGAEMIVWGGLYPSVRLNTGGRYDPTTDTWTATSTGANVPDARSGHSAVWTGSEMIIWGGGGSASLDTGGRYNPATDTWTPTSTGANVPVGRLGLTAVWTGTEMIVWGGGAGSQGFGLLQDTGGRYNPATDAWTTTSMDANVPAARSFHTAVWTGTEMIIWGGFGAIGSLDTGGRYDPSNDTWTATSTGANVPQARDDHTAVWTGTEMIIWGGQPSLKTGGRLDPKTDSWTATSTGVNVPDGRYFHTAVWTGSEMIIWGGYPLDSNLHLYCAPGCVVPSTAWRDLDADGYGDPGQSSESWTCGLPVGFVANAGDCDDANPAVHPGVVEACNGIDDDCDQVVPAGEADADGDGVRVCANDCNDSSPSVWQPPAEVSNLNVTTGSPANLSWDSQASVAGPETIYDLVSGNLGPVSGMGFAGISCLQAGGGNSYGDSRSSAAPDTGFWYLARARNTCGTGTYGSSERDASVPACP